MKTPILKKIVLLMLFFGNMVALAQIDQVGFSFNQGPGNLPADRVVVDYYQNLNGTFAGTISSVPFVNGFTNESGDYGFRPIGTTRVYFDVNEVSGFSNSWSDFTIELNFQFNQDIASFSNLITFDDDGSSGQAKVIRDSANQRLRIMLGDTNIFTNNLLEDTWYHLAVTYDASEDVVRAYQDGVLLGGISNGSRLLLQDPDRIAIAGNFAASGPWTAPIDDFRFTNSILDPSEFLLSGFGSEVVIPEPRYAAALLGLIVLVVVARRRKAQ